MRFAWLCFPVAALTLATAWVPPAEEQDAAARAEIARGEYLVNAIGCADCHTPWVNGPDGPAPDPTRHLSGHPQDLVLPPPPGLPPGSWNVIAADEHTAWAGPWGVSFTANLTPDPETGLGNWTVDTFIAALRTGRHMGKGRPILPPMPYPFYANLSDADLRAVFAYLGSVPPIRNRVPEPIPPAQ